MAQDLTPESERIYEEGRALLRDNRAGGRHRRVRARPIGRGSAAVDLTTIPTAIVKTVEVLRDGAAAQYGSDAISGVVNLRLRTDRHHDAVADEQGVRGVGAGPDGPAGEQRAHSAA